MNKYSPGDWVKVRVVREGGCNPWAQKLFTGLVGQVLRIDDEDCFDYVVSFYGDCASFFEDELEELEEM